MQAAPDLFDPSLSRADRLRLLREMAAQEERAERAALVDSFDEQSLLWLALAPGWTVESADACRFPGAFDGAAALFARMHAAGLVETYAPPELGTGNAVDAPFHTITESARSTILDPYRVPMDPEPMASASASASGSAPPPASASVATRVMTQLKTRITGNPAPDRLAELRKVVAEIGQRVGRMAEPAQVPPLLARWARLAAAATDSETLVAQLDRLTSAAAQRPLAEAAREIHDDVEAMKSFAWLMGSAGAYQLQLGMQRAGRRLELLQRRKHDEQHLQHFLYRSEQVDPFFELMDGPDAQWALHFAGAGGVGKTMLVRYIASVLTGDHPPGRTGPQGRVLSQVAVARIDFDYLNPDYPLLAPGLLLWAFGQELRAHDTSYGRTAIERFDAADRVLDEFHKSLRASLTGGAGDATQHPSFAMAVRLYIEGIQALGKRVVLILDTCEELAKAKGAAGSANVDETFRILRALHDGPRTLSDTTDAAAEGGAASLRVIFSGRRPLASAGLDWRCPTTALQPRPFLRLQALRGFTFAEAEGFLRSVGAPEDLIPAVRERSSPDAGPPFPIDYDDPHRAPPEIARCNPYDLRLYLDWVRERPPPSAETIRSAAGDQYVDLRIIRRLADADLEAVLPAAALLAHFDREALQAACSFDDDTMARVFRKLEDFEWTDVRSVATPELTTRRTALSIKRGIRGRLITYFQRRGGAGEQVWRCAADHLESVTLTMDLAALEWTVLDAAMRVLERDVPRAAAWWQRMEARLLIDRGADWTLRMLEVLLGDDGALAERPPHPAPETPPENALRPFVLATEAAALAASGSGVRALARWREVALLAGPAAASANPEMVRLARRAAAAGFATAVRLGSPIDAVAIEQASMALQQELASTPAADVRLPLCVATAEAMAELAESRGLDTAGDVTSTSLQAALTLAVQLGQRLDDEASANANAIANTDAPAPDVTQRRRATELAAFSLSTAARAALLLKRPAEARGLFERAQGLTPDSGGLRTRWVDWTAPDAIPDRVRLEYLRHAAGVGVGLSAVLRQTSSGNRAALSATIDGERRASLALQTLSMRRCADAATLAPWFDTERGHWPRPLDETIDAGIETCNAHRAVPPLFAVVAGAMGGTPWVGQALQRLEDVLEQGSRFRTEICRHAARTLLELLLEMRHTDDLGTGHTAELTLRTSDDPRDRAVLLKRYALDGLARDQGISAIDRPSMHASAASLHALWQTRIWRADRLTGDVDAAGWQGLMEPHRAGAGEFDAESMALDLEELARLQGGAAASRRLTAHAAQTMHATQPVQTAPSPPHQVVTLALRRAALNGSLTPQRLPAGLAAPCRRLGLRGTARLAFALGESLQLRLPAAAALLFDMAGHTFARCGDRFGMFAAHTLAFLSRVRAASLAGLAGLSDDTRARQLGPIRDAWRALRADWPPATPTWEALESFVAAPDSPAFDAFPVLLRPWLLRTLVCIHRGRAHPPADGPTAFDTWLVRHHGGEPAALEAAPAPLAPNDPFWARPPVLPFELDGVLSQAQAQVQAEAQAQGDNAATAAPMAAPAPAESGGFKKLKEGLATLLGLAILGGSIWGLLRATSWGVEEGTRAVGMPTPADGQLWYLSASLWFIVLFGWLAVVLSKRRIESLGAAFSELMVEIRPCRDPANGLELDLMLVTRRLQVLPWPQVREVSRRQVVLPHVRSLQPGVAPGADSEADVKADVLAQAAAAAGTEAKTGAAQDFRLIEAEFVALLGRLGRRQLTIEIVAPDALLADPLERDIWTALKHWTGSDIPPRSLAFLRRSVLRSGRRPIPTGPPLVAAPVSTDATLNKANASVSDAEADTLWIEGRFDFGSAGVRLLLASDPQASLSMSSGAERSRASISAERLAQRFPRAAACIIQYGGAPFDLSSELGQREAQLARAFASELALQGVGLVAVLPRSETDPTRALLEALAQRPASRADALLAAMCGLRGGYATSPGGADAAALGMSLWVDRDPRGYPRYQPA